MNLVGKENPVESVFGVSCTQRWTCQQSRLCWCEGAAEAAVGKEAFGPSELNAHWQSIEIFQILETNARL